MANDHIREATKKIRLIDANALVDAIEDIDWFHVNKKGKLVDGANPANNTPIYRAFDIYNAIKNAPTVDAVEVVHGEWIVVIDENDCECIECPLCCERFYDGDNDTFDKPYNYCPNCGAKMDK